jgi:hypothetical protein
MSELTDQIEKALAKLSEMNPGEVVDATDIKGVTDQDTMPGFQEYISKESMKTMRRLYRRFAGSPEFESSQEALDKTEDACIKEFSKLCASSLADGILVGQGKIGPVRKAAFFKKTGEVFDKEGFRSESNLFVLSAQDEFDFNEAIERYFRMSITVMASSTGFAGPTLTMISGLGQTHHKVWDLWLLAANSTCVGLYASGLIIGKEWAEQDVLAGIMSATAAVEESE